MEKPVNFRSKSTESESAALVSLWEARRDKVNIRKKYEDQIEFDNIKIKKEIQSMIEPIASSFQTPIEIIIETNRCVIQKKIFSSPKAKGSEFVTTISQDINSLDSFFTSAKGVKQFPIAVKKAIRRLNMVTKKNIGKPLHPLIKTPTKLVQDLWRQPGSPMVTVLYNVRTRYDF